LCGALKKKTGEEEEEGRKKERRRRTCVNFVSNVSKKKYARAAFSTEK
jgi:hypothetical protein